MRLNEVAEVLNENVERIAVWFPNDHCVSAIDSHGGIMERFGDLQVVEISMRDGMIKLELME